jgi:TRAP-type mannitol/chloroaromatic compound transport system substrate-binding protein
MEWRLARFPLGVTGFALGIGSFLGAVPDVVPLTVWIFCALSSGMADAHAWKGPRS